jgi:carbon monoxide dehydrogenase subunit G
MELKGELELKRNINYVKEFLLDPKKFTECLPGLQNYEVEGKNFKAIFKLDVSQLGIPHILTLTANINAVIMDEGNKIEVVGNGRSAGVGIKISILMELVETGVTVKLSWKAKIDLGMLMRLIGEESVRKIADVNVNYIVNCISTKMGN